MERTNKNLFLARLLRERDKFELLINRVGYTRRMTLKGVVGKLSIKDVLAQICTYEQYLADRMHEILYEQPYTPCKTQTALDAFLDEFGYPDFGSPLLDDNGPSEWIIERYKNVALEDVIAQELQAFSSIVSAFEQMPASLVRHHNIQNRISKHTYEHYRKNAREIRYWFKINDIELK